MPTRMNHSTEKVSKGFVLPEALRDAARREVARVRPSRYLFARIGAWLKAPALPRELRPRYASHASYYKHCKAQLTQALAPYWKGSRSGLKARVREILHPRRRDVSLLGGLLRATVAPAALAIFMLAANVEPAHAAESFLNPFDEQNIGFMDSRYKAPLAAVVGEKSSSPNSFKNEGNSCKLVAVQWPSANPFYAMDQDISSWCRPTFADLDGDGDQDVVVGNHFSLDYYLNNSTSEFPVFVKQPDEANPFKQFHGYYHGYLRAPAFADFDGDGDLDCIAWGRSYVGLYYFLSYYENSGTSVTPIFTFRNGEPFPLSDASTDFYATPTFADLDGDGDPDALFGGDKGIVKYFENIGTSIAPEFVERIGTSNPFAGVDVGSRSTPTLTDMDHDGDFDVVIGEEEGNLNYFENTGTPLAPVFTQHAGSLNPFDGLDIGKFSAPAIADFDGDGNLNAIIGTGDGIILAFEDTGMKFEPMLPGQAGIHPFEHLRIEYIYSSTFADIDDDGDQDAVIGTGSTFIYFENKGTPQVPVFAEQTGATNPFDDMHGRHNGTIAFADLDGDSDLDAVVGEMEGQLNYFENTGTSTIPVFTQQIGLLNPFDGVDLGYRSHPHFGDLDGDGDLDAFIAWRGSLNYFLNTGSPDAPLFEHQTGTANPFDGLDVGDGSDRTFADLDGDGDIDILSGDASGILRYFKNTGTVLAPLFVEQLNTDNPFNGVDVGRHSQPSFADLDGDGDVDTIVGEASDGVNCFITTNDCDAPSASCKDFVATLDLSGRSRISGSHIGDGSSDDADIASLTVTPSTFTCDNLGNNSVTLTVTDRLGNTATCGAIVTVQDLTAPVISLIGDAEVKVACGDIFTDAGVTASDTCEGSVTATVGGDTVDTSTPGVYTITYAASDGTNAATQVTRIVVVEDNCPTDYESLLAQFPDADADDDKLVTLAEAQTQVPGFTQQELEYADANGDGKLSVAELLEFLGGGILSSADTSGDSIVQLTELLRLIQFYNAGQYACAENAGATEDGFALTAPPSEPACVLHSVDQDGDKVITLSELLRGIQLYNLGGYTWCPSGGTEDGFCG